MPFDHNTDAAHREQLNSAQARLAVILGEVAAIQKAKQATYATLTAAEKDCVIGDMALSDIESLDNFLADSEMLIAYLQDSVCVVDINDSLNHPPLGHDEPHGVVFLKEGE